MSLNIDLHSHSSCSDGVLPPAQVAARAHAQGVDWWSLSDHDETSGLAEAAAAARALGLGFIPGVEISVTFCERTIHVLGLHIDPDQPDLNAGLAGIRRSRFERAGEIAERLRDCGIDGAYEGALRHVDNPDLISRVHFARHLLEQGHCKSLQQAFDRYLGEGKRAFVPTRWPSLESAVAWIRAASGKAVIAHPGRYRYTPLQFDALFDAFKALGGSGLEVVSSGHTPAQCDHYARVAQAYGFEASRGSDFHAPGTPRAELGRVPPLPDGLVPVWRDWI
ncbi:MAG: PHP domain-containing protein [Castellaniella sp.]|uniref:PHP domain-containing protein n=1 Tax=Castellaniella sp. TaxID=1955812 RepID=UPI002A35EAE5|nr:PHP domain-containing protein [Castellaniella sp.]MDY0308572.1 PHP domain-containing protein [Castellaniella sp.]